MSPGTVSNAAETPKEKNDRIRREDHTHEGKRKIAKSNGRKHEERMDYDRIRKMMRWWSIIP